MSSTSPNHSQKAEALVLTDGWPGLVVARALHSLGVKTLSLLLPPPLPNPMPYRAVSLGNGEAKEKAKQIFGEGISKTLWDLSRSNYEKLSALLQTCQVPLEEKGVEWNLKETTADDLKGFTFSQERLCAALQALVPTRLIEKVVSFRKHGNFDVELHCQSQGGEFVAKGSSLVVVSEFWAREQLPSLHDKIIPVTLGSLTYSSSRNLPFSLSLFHGGADFAICAESTLTVGSYRNLFEDRAVGLHSTIDPITKKGLLDFFGAKGWIDREANPRVNLNVEALSCDGLPIVGPVAEGANIFCVAGFSGRIQNFICSLAEHLAAGLSRAGKVSELDLFSTKRF